MSAARSPLISIGMPVYNGSRYLVEALESLLAQTCGDFELIISDNASTDSTAEICQDYAANDARIRYFRQPQNLGAIGNFNWTFTQASGRFFKWAACDDLCAATFLERCVDELQRRPDCVWCHCDSDMIDQDGRSWIDRLPADDEEIELDRHGNRSWKGLPRDDFDHQRPDRRYAGVLLGTRWSVDSYGLIRSDALRQTRMLVDLYGAEKVLMGELSLLGKSYQIPELLFRQRIHAEASSFVSSAQAQQQFVTARQAKPFFSTRLSLLEAHRAGIAHASLSTIDRIRCYGVLTRYAMQINKWGRVLRTTLRRESVGGGGRRIIEAAAACDSDGSGKTSSTASVNSP